MKLRKIRNFKRTNSLHILGNSEKAVYMVDDCYLLAESPIGGYFNIVIKSRYSDTNFDVVYTCIGEILNPLSESELAEWKSILKRDLKCNSNTEYVEMLQFSAKAIEDLAEYE